jgi:hypothetical protein
MKKKLELQKEGPQHVFTSGCIGVMLCTRKALV